MIKTRTVMAFLANLEGSEVFNKEVFVDSTMNPVNEDGSVFDVTIHASAVLIYPEGGEALLLCGEDCGRDRRTADGDRVGTEILNGWRDQIQDYCNRNGLVVKPGILDA